MGDNINSIDDYLENEIPKDWVVEYVDNDGTYAEAVDHDGNKWEIHKSYGGGFDCYRIDW